MNYLYKRDEKKRLMNLLEGGARIVYISLNKDEISNIRVQNVFPEGWILGIPSANRDRKAYYLVKSRVQNETTFQNIFSFELLMHLSLKQQVYVFTISNSKLKLNNKRIHIIRSENRQKFISSITKILDSAEKPIIAIDSEMETHQIIKKFAFEYPEISFLDVSYIFEKQSMDSDDSDMQFPSETSFFVTVVLTLYKRPEVLRYQYDAIRQQTLLPSEIILFQDQIKNGERVKIDDTISPLFDRIEIADENVGVWGRFKFARDYARGPYVCLFDDDTIPGECWLESCHFHMQNKLAVYSTLGISLIKSQGYPYNGFYRIGWSSANRRCEEVDFAGHAWFIKREWLSWMFENTERYQEIRYAAEDMCLSVKAAQHDIPTIITPHPYKNKSVWGSQYEDALKYGNSKAALGINGNYKNMYNALNMLINDGWKPMHISRKLYVNLRYILQKIRIGVFKICGIKF